MTPMTELLTLAHRRFPRCSIGTLGISGPGCDSVAARKLLSGLDSRLESIHSACVITDWTLLARLGDDQQIRRSRTCFKGKQSTRHRKIRRGLAPEPGATAAWRIVGSP